jgi:metal transporter CNNM
MYLFGKLTILRSPRETDHPLAPIAWPIAKLLDYVLGKNDIHTYKKAELKSFLQFHRTGEEPLREDEISILNGVLELNTKKVESIMTPMTVGSCLSM